jgi:hypothetical protein
MSMHADENSDGVIVPEKRPNKEGLPSAEAVEGRTSPKGNGGETAAARTLRRDTASNGLIAVRRAARQSKSVRFTALLHHVSVDLLKARAMANILATQSAEMRTKGEAMIQQADKLLCESWNERMWSDGEPIDPSPTIDQAINGGFPWL